jgi:aldehyde:ferredoxin oxidoreductase
VKIPAPVWNVQPPVNNPVAPAAVQAVVPALPKEHPEDLFGPAVWVKVFVTESPEPAELQHLVWGNPAEGMICENFSAVKFCGIWCDFWAVTPEQIGQIFRHAWKREFSDDDVFQIGERVWNLGRLFNLREGVEPDDIPKKLYAEEGAHTTGASAGRAIGTATFKAALQEFYQLRGWDENGVPSEAKLAELGVDVRL